ncbi:GNAT family N-acetyltransferase [Enterococcus casseliflavus]|uniref:GNAT family N-acetyltransferase n=1 Tax=Enterococcus casseliflavus TaxID=37734 RepID=UPI003D0CA7E2
MSKKMIIYSENFKLRAIEESDQKYLKKMINDPQIEGSVGGWSFPVSDKSQEKWFMAFENSIKNIKLSIENTQGEFLGIIAASDIDMKNGNAELHIKLLESSCKNKGVGTEVMSAFTDYCFDQLRLHCLYAHILEDNIASIKMFQKCGFTKEGLLRERIFKNGEYKNVLVLSKCNRG